MDYNTSRSQLTLPEYGRNIQSMVEHIKTIEDREERNLAALAIINIMGNMNPHLRDINDFKHKLWDQLAIMSNFDLDIDSPYPTPTIETLTEKPARIPYKTTEMKFRNYGRIIEFFIKEAKDYDEEQKEALLKIVGGHMKKTYFLWNNEHVSDESICDIIKQLTKGEIDLPPTFKFEEATKTKKRR